MRETAGKKNAGARRFVILGLAVPVIACALFWFGTSFNSVLLAFQENNLDGSTSFGFVNFKAIFDEILNPYSLLLSSTKNTFAFFFFGLLVGMPLCYIISFFIFKKIPGYSWFRFIFFLPSIFSSVVITSFVKFMLSPDGPIPEIWFTIFGNRPMFLQDSDYAMNTLLVYGLWAGFGLNLVLYTAAFNRIPSEIIEAGKLDGLGFWSEIRYILFPLTWPFFSTMIMLSVTGIFGASGPILLFTKGAYDTYTISYWIYVQTANGFNLPIAAAFGLILTLITLPLVLLVRRLSDKVEVIEY